MLIVRAPPDRNERGQEVKDLKARRHDPVRLVPTLPWMPHKACSTTTWVDATAPTGTAGQRSLQQKAVPAASPPHAANGKKRKQGVVHTHRCSKKEKLAADNLQRPVRAGQHESPRSQGHRNGCHPAEHKADAELKTPLRLRHNVATATADKTDRLAWSLSTVRPAGRSGS